MYYRGSAAAIIVYDITKEVSFCIVEEIDTLLISAMLLCAAVIFQGFGSSLLMSAH